MSSTSALLNTELRRHVAPVLREAGFQHVDARNGWSWRDDCVWVFNIRAVGNYFSEGTGWPPGSVGVWLGVYFTFAPQVPDLKHDPQGRPLPAEYLCHMRTHLDRRLEQRSFVGMLSNPLERARTDLWWVEADGRNAGDVATDIAGALQSQGLPWFREISDLNTALAAVEATHDCFTKFTKAALLARRIGDHQRWHKYDQLAEAEARRIGQSLDRDTWYAIS